MTQYPVRIDVPERCIHTIIVVGNVSIGNYAYIIRSVTATVVNISFRFASAHPKTHLNVSKQLTR